VANVDDRIVAMQFDNQRFEDRLSTTLASLDKLKKSLDFTNENRNLSGLQKAAGSFQMDGLANAADHIAGKLTAMGAVGFSVIENLVTRAVDGGARIIKAFSFAPTLDGFHEYETNLNSIQTILANTQSDNTTLDQVNAALNKLNVYSDQTIYNFGQMAKNIGTFTAAGVDLDTSVNAIKGIANLAALSGSSADQASSAMYQLSQALSTGKLKLIDWNSVVNAGIGGEIFKKSLFETGKALGTLTNVPVSQTFEEWEKANGSFRDSLESGWITADVLTTTLGGFTGDLTEEMLVAKGFTEQQALNILKTAATAKAAATEVKTFTQLIGTVKEAVGTSWADSFSIIIGNFTESKALWTGVNNAIGEFISKSADARNNLLQGWKDLGGREVLINNFKNIFGSLGDVIQAVHVAFREIFPATTAKSLFNMTVGFGMLIDRLKPSTETIIKIGRVFSGLFATIEIGWTVLKNIASLFADIFNEITDGLGGGTLDLLANFGDTMVTLNESLVAGGGIKRFFDDIRNLIDLFKGGFSDGIEGVTEATGRLGDRFGWLGGIAESLGKAIGYLKDHFDVIRDAATHTVEAIAGVFGSIGHSIAQSMKTGNFDEVFDTINAGLFTALLVMMRKFLANGVRGFGGNMVSKISNMFNQLTGVLKAMQLELKSDALLNIAKAVGLLTISLVALSLIDSAALTKAITAMSVGFGELVGVMALLTKVTDGVKGATEITILAVAMGALATAMLILSAAVKVLSTMSWGDLAKGMSGVAALLLLIAGSVKLMPDSKSLISTGIGMAAIAVAVRILANAVQAMAQMSWAEMAKGLTGVAVALGLIVGATQLISPTGMIAAGAGMAALAVGMNIIVGAIALMGNMDVGKLVKGLAGLGAALLIIAGAMQLMPLNLPITGAGLILVGTGLTAVAGAMNLMSNMSWGEMAKGLAGIAAVLVVLGVAMNAMSGTVVGAASIFVAASALAILAHVMKEMSKLSWGQMLKGLVGMAAALGVLGIAAALITATIPSLLGLGAALLLIGAGFALFGIGAAGVANALKLVADTGSVAIDALLEIIKVLLDKLPDFAEKLSLALIIVANKLLQAIPGMIAHVSDILVALLQAMIDTTPKFLETIEVIMVAILDHMTSMFPMFIDKGFELLMQLLGGILMNIAQVTDTVVNIVLTFLAALAARLPEIVAAGLNLLVQFLLGIANNIQKVIDAGFQIIVKIIEGVASGQADVIAAGAKLIIDFVKGIASNALKIVDAGVNAMVSFLQGLVKDAGKLANGVGKFIVGLLDAFTAAIKTYAPKIRAAGIALAGAILDGMTFGIAGKIGGVVKGAVSGVKSVIGGVAGALGIGGPSKVFMGFGEGMMDGLAIGVEAAKSRAEKSAGASTTDIVRTMNKTLSSISLSMGQMDDLNPKITPVVDLSNVTKGAAQISKMMTADTLVAQASFNQAAQISLVSNGQNGSENETPPVPVVKEVKFEQTINAPTALSASDIYRNTRTQIMLAKEELGVA
jgi:tape measure domain-containing protein